MSRIATEISSFAANNNGRIPATNDDLDEVFDRYVGCGSGADAQDATSLGNCTVDVADPSSGDPMVIAVTTSGVDGDVPAATQGEIDYQLQAACDGESLQVGGSLGNRNYAMWTQLEGGAVYCVDNS